MQLPRSTTPAAPTQGSPAPEPGALTSKLTAPTEALPGDHGARFGDELAEAAARSNGRGAEGRRGERRADGQRQRQRAERGEATEAREARRRKAAEEKDRGGVDTDQGLGPTETTQAHRRGPVAASRTGQARASQGDTPAGSRPDLPDPSSDPAVGSAQDGGHSMTPTAPGASAPAAPTSAASATTRVASVDAAARPQRPGSQAPSATQNTVAPRREAAAEATGTKPRPDSDPMGELLTRREEAIERDAAILRQLRAQLAPGRRELTMRLDPADLGRLQLRLALRSGRLTATVRAESPEALAAIERQLPELAASLESQGFEVQDFDLELADGALTDHGPADDRPTPAPAAPLANLLNTALGDAAPEPDRTPSPAPRRSQDPSRLDLFV